MRAATRSEPFGAGGITGAADAAAVLSTTGPMVAAWRDRPGANRPPAAGAALPDRRLPLPGMPTVDVSQVFVDPDSDALTYIGHQPRRRIREERTHDAGAEEAAERALWWGTYGAIR